jgi:hypothetical protein
MTVVQSQLLQQYLQQQQWLQWQQYLPQQRR